MKETGMARRAVAVKEEPTIEEDQSFKYEFAALVKRVEALEASRPGRKAKPLIALRQDGVCAVTPDIDSSTCPDSSIFRYQQGCHGDACKAKQHAAYERRKEAKAVAIETSVSKPKRAAPKKNTEIVPAKPIRAAKKVAPPSKKTARRIAALA